MPKPFSDNKLTACDNGSMSREELGAALAAAAAAPADYPQGRYEGRGIVVCAGGARLFTCAWICIGMLRRLGCTLPVEVWHLGPEEMGAPMRGLLQELGAETVDAHEVAKRHGVRRLGGWELKPFALLHCRFHEVLLLDADNVPVKNPAGLFAHAEFARTGALFWPDLMRLARNNPIWQVAGLPSQSCNSFESGQILIDKARSWRALMLTHWINQHSDQFYDVLHGDKDTFLIAWLMLAQPFHLVPHPPKQLAATICQRGPDGSILFQHRNGAKWALRGVNPRIEGFRHEADCFALLAELDRKWDGHVFNPPPRSERAMQLERSLGGGRFRYVRVSSDERTIELRPDHRIGGAGGDEFYWHVEGGEDEQIVLTGNGAVTVRLSRAADGTWHGRLSDAMALPVAMVPLEAPAPQPEPQSDRGVLQILERALAAYESLPLDGETTRDFVGLVRALALLDPLLRDRLDTLATGPANDKKRLLIARALEGWPAAAQRPDGGGVAEGHGWQRHHFPRLGYEPAD